MPTQRFIVSLFVAVAVILGSRCAVMSNRGRAFHVDVLSSKMARRCKRKTPATARTIRTASARMFRHR